MEFFEHQRETKLQNNKHEALVFFYFTHLLQAAFETNEITLCC